MQSINTEYKLRGPKNILPEHEEGDGWGRRH